MPKKNVNEIETPSLTIGWSVTVKPVAGQQIKGFWLVHSGDNVPTQTYNNPTSVPPGGVTLSQLLQSTGSKDGWTFVYMDGNNNLWTNGDWLQGSKSGAHDLQNDEGFTNCTITITPGLPNSSGFVQLTIAYSYMDGEGQPQQGTVSPLNYLQCLNTLD